MAKIARGGHAFEGPGQEAATFPPGAAGSPGFGPGPTPGASPDQQGTANTGAARPGAPRQVPGGAAGRYVTGGEPPADDPGI